MVDFQKEKQNLPIEQIARLFAPGGKTEGGEYSALCPCREDKTIGSFRINLTTGAWADFSAGKTGGDIISYVAYCKSIKQSEALEEIKHNIGTAPPAPPAAKPKKVFRDPPDYPLEGTKAESYIYRNESNIEIGRVLRFDLPAGKTFRPYLKTADGWTSGWAKEKKPLYGLELLSRPLPVLLVEGERKCNAARQVVGNKYNVLSISGGSAGSFKADLSPLRTKEIIVWPDADVPGEKAAAAILKELPCRIVQIPQDKKGTGWDIHDAIKEGMDIEAMLAPLPAFTKDIVPLGYNGTQVYLYAKSIKTYFHPQAYNLCRELMAINPDDNYWMQAYPNCVVANKGFVRLDREEVAKTLVRECHATKRNIAMLHTRGPGIYHDNGRVIANYGDRIFVDGTEASYEKIKSAYFYESSGDSHIHKAAIDATAFYNLLRSLTFANEVDTSLFMGTIFAGYLSGAADWRTHLWINGETGSGKSNIKDMILIPALVPIHGHAVSGLTTEAAIRQRIGNAATIFVHDEAENSKNMERELEFIRNSSTGAEVIRGTADHKSVSFSSCSTFILLSISSSIKKQADEQRMIKIALHQSKDSLDNWEQKKATIKAMCTEEFFSAVMQRAERLTRVFRESMETFGYQFVKRLKQEHNTDTIRRYSQTYAFPLCGYWHWFNDHVISENAINDIVNKLEASGKLDLLIKPDEYTNNALTVYEDLLNYKLRDGNVERPVRIVEDAGTLIAHGMAKLKDVRSGMWKLFLINGNQSLREVFDKIGFSDYKTVLQGAPGYERPEKPVYVPALQIVKRGIFVELPQQTAQMSFEYESVKPKDSWE